MVHLMENNKAKVLQISVFYTLIIRRKINGMIEELWSCLACYPVHREHVVGGGLSE